MNVMYLEKQQEELESVQRRRSAGTWTPHPRECGPEKLPSRSIHSSSGQYNKQARLINQ
jgi:hypothetical protein